MKSPQFCRLSALSLGLALSVAGLRADDSSAPPVPPPPPASPATSPADGGQGHHRRRPGFVLEELTQKLSLTADQQRTVGGIIANSRSQAKELRGDDSLSKDDRRQKLREIMDAAKSQIRAALTPDQQKIFDALPANGGNPPPPPPAN